MIELLEYCRKNKKKIDAVIVYRLDRISRQTADYLAIRKKLTECEITLLSATEPTGNSPTEKLVETILAGFAQLDNDVRRERTINGMRARFLSGLPNGNPPMGYKMNDGYPIKDPETWTSVKKAWELMSAGKHTLEDVATILNEQGVRQIIKKKEYPVRAQTMSRIFKNKFYFGMLTSRTYPEEVKGQHVPMITEAEFYRVQGVISGRNNSAKIPIAKKNRNNPDFPLRRVVKCGKCGTPFTGAWSSGNTTRHAYYFCRNRCGTPSVKAYELDFTTAEYLKHISPTKECLDAFIALLRSTYYKRASILQKKKNESEAELEKLYKLRQSLIEKNLAGTYSDEIFKEQNKLLEEQITVVQMTQDDALLEKYNLESVVEFMKEKFADLGKTYQQSDISQVRVLISSIFPSGLTWDYPGYSNHEISPLYQYVCQFENAYIPICNPSDYEIQLRDALALLGTTIEQDDNKLSDEV